MNIIEEYPILLWGELPKAKILLAKEKEELRLYFLLPIDQTGCHIRLQKPYSEHMISDLKYVELALFQNQWAEYEVYLEDTEKVYIEKVIVVHDISTTEF